jgi:hypothetical protein
MTYGKGDTIGVGVLFDSFNQRKAYFTKNGQYVGTSVFSNSFLRPY